RSEIRRRFFNLRARRRIRAVAAHAAADQRLAGIGRSCESATLNALPEGVIIVDGDSRVIFANRVAEALLTVGDGMSLRHAKLCASFPADTAALQAAIAAATPGRAFGCSGQTLALQRTSLRRPVAVVVAPLAAEAAWFLAHSPAAILFVSDPEQSHCVALPDQLRALFGLTRTEALVAAEIFRGEGLQAAADALGIGVTTARTHLQ